MKEQKMKAIVATGYGSADVLQFCEVDRPRPKNDQVLVKVIATSATKADVMMRTGKPFFTRLFLGIRKPTHPIPGTGFAGYVEEIGQQVTKYKIGDRVFGLTTLGFSANAEFLVIKESGVLLAMPENLHFAEAATYGDGHLTSFNFLKKITDVQPGQSVLINGAAGSLGSAAVQIAKYYGAEVTAVASGRNAGLVKSLGADYFIDYTQEDFTKSKKKFDLVFDAVGMSSFAAAKSILKEKGVYLSTVMKLPLILQTVMTKYFSAKKAVFEATGLNSDQKLREMLAQVLEIHREGKLKTVIDRQYPLSRLPEAHRYIDAGHKKGNIVILIE